MRLVFNNFSAWLDYESLNAQLLLPVGEVCKTVIKANAWEVWKMALGQKSSSFSVYLCNTGWSE